MTRLKADLGLMSITVFWGSTFIISKYILNDIPVSLYLMIRFSMAALILNLIIIRKYGQISIAVSKDGFLLGIMLFITFFFQMWGIRFTTASNAGFITGLSVILVPIIGFVILRLKPAANVATGIVFALIGLLLLTGANPLEWNQGDYLVLICTIFVATHIIYTGRVAHKHNVFLLTGIQLIVLAFMSLIMVMITGADWSGLSWYHLGGLLYLAIFATVYTYLMQTAMQRFTTPARTALIFSLEPVFAALFAMSFSAERLGAIEWLGGALIILSMILAEAPLEKWINLRKHSA